MMKATVLAPLIGVMVTMLVGCVSPQRGAAYGHEQELRRQLAESVPMKDYGYTIKDLRFSPDYKKVLVVFSHPNADDNARRPDWEFVLTADEFARYRGSSMQPFYTPGTALTPATHITATLPIKR